MSEPGPDPAIGTELHRERGRLDRRSLVDSAGKALTGLCLALAALFLAILLYDVLQRGIGVVDWGFLTEPVNGRNPEEGGVFNAMVGSIYLMLVTLAVAVPLGIASAVFLEEFAEDTRFTEALQRLIENLAGVPSIVFGLLGLALFVRLAGFGTSLLAGGLTLGLLVLPIIVVSTQEALASVPEEFRNAARAVGATEWQVVKDHVLPAALPGIVTGCILGLARAIGETAPILFMAAVFVRGVPEGLLDGFLALPIQIFQWAQFPSEDVQAMGAGAIIVLLGLLLSMNAIAVAIRQWSLSRRNW